MDPFNKENAELRQGKHLHLDAFRTRHGDCDFEEVEVICGDQEDALRTRLRSRENPELDARPVVLERARTIDFCLDGQRRRSFVQCHVVEHLTGAAHADSDAGHPWIAQRESNRGLR